MNPQSSSVETTFGVQNDWLPSALDLLPDAIFIKDKESRMVYGNLAHARATGVHHPEAIVGKTDFDCLPEGVASQSFADEQTVLLSGQPLDREEPMADPRTGETRWFQTTRVPMRDAASNIIGVVGINRDITRRKQAEETLRQAHTELEQRVADRLAELTRKNAELATANTALQQQIGERKQTEQALARERLLLRTLIDNLPDAIYAKDVAGRKILANPADLKNLRCQTEAEAMGKTDYELFPAEIAAQFVADDQAVLQTGQPVLWREEYFFDEAGQKHWLLTSKLPMRDAQGTIVGLMGIGRDITSLKAAEERLEVVHRELLAASRQAGMAEVATGVLHNVGNVLNSVNVSTALITQRLKGSKITGVGKLAQLLGEHQADLARFLSEDERGRQVPTYLEQLAQHLEQERAQLSEELAGLTRNIEHIKEIVAMQQNYAVVLGVVEQVALADLVEDAIKIHGGAYLRHGVTVLREYEPVPHILADKHKVLQILVNLLSNAKYACDASQQRQKQVTVRLRPDGSEKVLIQVVDNGIGIAAENLSRIFSQGFTTRKGGHGFGLHSGALAARELGGALSVHSEGLGQGATFCLELPVAPPTNHPPKPARP